MCRWMAYAGPPIFLDTVLFDSDNSFVNQSLNARWSHVVTNGDGFGIGWYGDRERSGLYRDVRPAWNDDNLLEVSEKVGSRLFFAHVRAAEGASGTSRSNYHPFRHENWLFTHNGQIPEYNHLRRDLDMRIPDDLYRHKQGTTDSETIFFLLLVDGLADDPAAAYRQTMTVIQEEMTAHGADATFKFSAIATDGDR